MRLASRLRRTLEDLAETQARQFGTQCSTILGAACRRSPNTRSAYREELAAGIIFFVSGSRAGKRARKAHGARGGARAGNGGNRTRFPLRVLQHAGAKRIHGASRTLAGHRRHAGAAAAAIRGRRQGSHPALQRARRGAHRSATDSLREPERPGTQLDGDGAHCERNQQAEAPHPDPAADTAFRQRARWRSNRAS